MIKANELRIGNLLNWEVDHVGGGMSRVTNISEHEFEIESITGCHPRKDEGTIEPILLTPEWLQRCGLKRKEHSRVYMVTLAYADSNYPCTLQQASDGFQVCRSGIGAITAPVEYLHQLQNLIYCLTGEELVITPPQP